MKRHTTQTAVAGLMLALACVLVAGVGHAQQYTLTLQVQGPGSTNPAPGTYQYANGGFAFIQARADVPGYAFDQWTGDIGGADPQGFDLGLTMDRDRTVTAVFVEGDWTLTLQVDGNGTTMPPPGTYTYLDGDRPLVGGLPEQGYAFERWEGDIETSFQYFKVTMDADKTITAVFSEGDWTLTVAHEGPGSGTTSLPPGDYRYTDERPVRVTANVFPGSYWGGWHGDGGGFAREITLTMDSDKTLTARFDDSGTELTLSKTGEGNTDPEPGTYLYSAGATVELFASPSSTEWRFDHWEGDIGDTIDDVPWLVLTMDQNRAVTAVFSEMPMFTLTTDVAGSGSVEPAGTNTYYNYQFVFVKATPAPGWEFSHWEGNLGGEDPNDPTITVTMSENRALTAVFTEIESYSLTLSVTGQGALDPPAGEYTFAPDETVALAATPAEGWRFLAWQGDIGGADPGAPDIDLLMNTDRMVTAIFEETPVYTLSLAVTGNGTTAPSPGSASYYAGAEVSIEAIPDPNWNFSGWEGDIGEEANPEMRIIQVTMDQSRGITAAFTREPFHAADWHEGRDLRIDLSELLRVIQLYRFGEYSCAQQGDISDDGYMPGSGNQECAPHTGDYAGQPDWSLNLNEILRIVQFYNGGGYRPCFDMSPPTEDGFCVAD